jgi:hypothetical protein
LAVDPMKAAYWKTPRPLATLGPSDDTANGLPLFNSTTQLNQIEWHLLMETYSNMDRRRTSSGSNSLSARRCSSQMSLDPHPNLSAWTAVSR